VNYDSFTDNSRSDMNPEVEAAPSYATRSQDGEIVAGHLWMRVWRQPDSQQPDKMVRSHSCLSPCSSYIEN
jgi:hypothetical protein